MIALVLAGLVLGSVALVWARSRREPERKPVRIEVQERRKPPRR